MAFINLQKASNTILHVHRHIMSYLISLALEIKSKGSIVFCLVCTEYRSVNNDITQLISQQILSVN